ncbi:TetR/AcrR family transcriptional regulator [Motiliproteus sp.]|uniref:TetR/AcrR family transcriptional regulator n=1 Tax=Motiliproteus sp. TaxID=1898955 RepID=UPI003BAAF598
MNATQLKIAAGLEQAFADHGFAQIGVDGLREATQVSLRTLYKYCPSREAMVITALEHRHQRYLAHLLDELPTAPTQALDQMFDRIGNWMEENAPQGCLFKSAVAAHPDSEVLQKMLERHKLEVCDGLTRATGLSNHRDELLLLHEAIIHSWPMMGARAVASAKRFGQQLFNQAAPS